MLEAAQILTPDVKHRIRFNSEAFAPLEPVWRENIAKKGLHSYMGPGLGGSIVVIEGTFVDAIKKALTVHGSRDLAQFKETRRLVETGVMHLWKISPYLEANRVTITIPKEIRAIGLYPETSPPVIVAMHGNRFEIRPVGKVPELNPWVEEVAAAIERLRQLTEEDWSGMGVELEGGPSE